MTFTAPRVAPRSLYLNASLNSVGHPLATAVLTMGWIKNLRRRPGDAAQSVECLHAQNPGANPQHRVNWVW